MTEAPRIFSSDFRPAAWLRHRHLQTIYPSLPWAYRQRPRLRRERFDLPDGDVTALDWVEPDATPAEDAPLLVILHGLESSADSAYARMLMQAAAKRSWHCCVLHFRDCGEFANRLPRRYHAGETDDVRYFLRSLPADLTDRPVYLVGYSLGGNVLLKYLGEAAGTTPVSAAVAVCVPLNLHLCADSLNHGFSMILSALLVKKHEEVGRSKIQFRYGRVRLESCDAGEDV